MAIYTSVVVAQRVLHTVSACTIEVHKFFNIKFCLKNCIKVKECLSEFYLCHMN